MLQYIVNGNNAQEIVSTATSALDNGCRWIRLDLSKMPQNEVETAVNSLKEKCAQLEAFLSIENDVETTSAMKVSSVHLSVASSAEVINIRKQLGEETIIGITVAEAANVPFVPRTAIDYIAAASDDIIKCCEVVKQMKATGFVEPVIAPYSQVTPLETLMDTGINGIAVHNSTIPPDNLQELLNELNTLIEHRLNNL